MTQPAPTSETENGHSLPGEYDFEGTPGLPGRLPAGETVLWQGSPDWASFARRAFHVRKVAFYFAIIAAWRAALTLYDGGTVQVAVLQLGVFAILAALAIGVLTVMAYAIAKTTIYTLTNRRIVLRFGIAVQKSVNLPFAMVESAALKLYPNGTGDIPLIPVDKARLSYLVLWPHARPWRFGAPEPMLRCIPEAETVARTMADAFAAAVPGRIRRGELAPAANTSEPTGRLSPAAG